MVKKPERYPDVILFPKAGSGPPPVSVWQQQKFPESLYVVIKRAGRDSVLNTPLTIRKSAGSALADQF